jgi:hypothetical protein
MCVSAALLLLPTRASFLLTLAGGDATYLSELPAKLAVFAKDVTTVREVLEAKLKK